VPSLRRRIRVRNVAVVLRDRRASRTHMCAIARQRRGSQAREGTTRRGDEPLLGGPTCCRARVPMDGSASNRPGARVLLSSAHLGSPPVSWGRELDAPGIRPKANSTRMCGWFVDRARIEATSVTSCDLDPPDWLISRPSADGEAAGHCSWRAIRKGRSRHQPGEFDSSRASSRVVPSASRFSPRARQGPSCPTKPRRSLRAGASVLAIVRRIWAERD
jgi:hypothetical protein